MATIANIFDRFNSSNSAAAEEAVAHTRELSDVYRLRSLPNEDVYFYTKRIDNSRVVRQADPRANQNGLRVFGGASLVAALVIAILVPSGYGLMAGFKVNALMQENRQLMNERTRLQLEEAKLVSAEHLQELAEKTDLQAPKPSQVIYVAPKSDSSLALNRSN